MLPPFPARLGVDASGRASDALQRVMTTALSQPSLPPVEFLRAHCSALLRAASTTEAEDEALLASGGLSSNMETAVRYRLRWKRALKAALDSDFRGKGSAA